ncbi:MAG: peptidyl-prolyl cis-trans isomerase [Holosporales bacterium]|jgi:hypothetical protein|nr:peptidyl-prolyl cis-trans isomerase [Holosporales bacterium]
MSNLKRFVMAAFVVALLPSGVHSSASAQPKSQKQLKWETEDAERRQAKAQQDTADKQKAIAQAVVVLKDGTLITEAEVNETMREIPTEVADRMTMGQLRLFVTMLLTYRRVAELETAGMQLDETEKKRIEQRIGSIVAAMFLRRSAEALMTDDAIREHYDKTFDKMVKGKKAVDVNVIMVRDKADVTRLKAAAKSEASLNKFLGENPGIINTALTNRLPDTLPPEVAKAVSENGTGRLIGPFPVRNVLMFFYITKVYDAKKEPLTDAMIPHYKKVAHNDFMKKALRKLYEEYKVEVYNHRKQKVDPFDIKAQSDPQDTKDDDAAAIAALKDDYVFAQGENGDVIVKVTVGDVKTFFAIPSLSGGALKDMGIRFKMPLGSVIIYAVKMVMDERLAGQEIKKQDFYKNPDVVKTVSRETNDERFHIYIGKVVNVADADITSTYRKLVSVMDKDDHEVSAKLVLYDTKEEAESALRSVLSGDKKFATLYESAVKENRMEFKNATKRSVSPAMWGAIKGTAAAACSRTVVEVETNDGDVRWAVLFVANRRVIPLPTLNDPGVKQKCTALAFQEKAVLKMKDMITERVETISGQPANVILDNPAASEILKHIISTPRM